MDLVAISQSTTVSSSPPVANIADEAENAQTRMGEPLECWISQTFSPSYTAKYILIPLKQCLKLNYINIQYLFKLIRFLAREKYLNYLLFLHLCFFDKRKGNKETKVVNII